MLKIRKRVSECLYGMMEECIPAIGRMVNNMVRGKLGIRMDLNMKENGLMEGKFLHDYYC
jgi:hypothetical protein